MGRTIAIAGGGIVGRTLAVALATQSQASVRLFAGPPPGADVRASAIAAGTRRMFARLGVWPLAAGEAEPVRCMRITDSSVDDLLRPELLTFEGEVDGTPFAHVVANEALHHALVARCEAVGVREAPVAVSYYEDTPRGVSLSLSDGGEAQAEVLVAADGRASRLRRIADIEVVERRYEQSAVVGTVAHELAHGGTAVQHFLPHGPFAMLPLPGNRSSIVWTEQPAFAEEIVALDPPLAALEIERIFGLTLGRITLEGALRSHPLSTVLARRWVAGRLALAGDAAHVVHPLAGQGLNLGLRDAATLAQVLVEAARQGEDLALALPRYERLRRADATQMALAMEAFNALFSRRSDLARAVRSVGLALVDRRPRLKALFMREAAGLEGEVPRLMRGEAL